VALGDAKELRAVPSDAEIFKVLERRDAVVDPCGKEDFGGVAEGQGLGWREEVKHRLCVTWCVAAGAERVTHHGGSGVFPDGFLRVYDGLDEGDEAEVFFQHGKECSDPPAVACADEGEFLCALGAQ